MYIKKNVCLIKGRRDEKSYINNVMIRGDQIIHDIQKEY